MLGEESPRSRLVGADFFQVLISLHGVLPSGSRGTVLGLRKQNPPLLQSIAELNGELRGPGSVKQKLPLAGGHTVTRKGVRWRSPLGVRMVSWHSIRSRTRDMHQAGGAE